jgi:hypothetical protein
MTRSRSLTNVSQSRIRTSYHSPQLTTPNLLTGLNRQASKPNTCDDPAINLACTGGILASTQNHDQACAVIHAGYKGRIMVS